MLGNEGFDRLHITGKLNSDVDEAGRITAQMNADSVEVAIEALAEMTFLGDITSDILTLSFEKQFAIAAQGIDAFTDALENKRTIRLEGDALTGEALPFTNYEIVELVTKYESYEEVPVLDPDTGLPMLDENGDPLTELVGINPYEVLDFTSQLTIPEGGLLFTNIIYDAGDEGEVTIDNLLAEGMNVLVTGKYINVNGDITGKTYCCSRLARDDVVIEGSLEIVDDDLSEEDMSLELGLYEAKSDRRIQIGAERRSLPPRRWTSWPAFR